MEKSILKYRLYNIFLKGHENKTPICINYKYGEISKNIIEGLMEYTIDNIYINCKMDNCIKIDLIDGIASKKEKISITDRGNEYLITINSSNKESWIDYIYIFLSSIILAQENYKRTIKPKKESLLKLV